MASDERKQIVAFLAWWSKDQARLAETTPDPDREIEFSIRAEALADAARDVFDFGDVRHAQGMEARQGRNRETGSDPKDESAVVAISGDAPNIGVSNQGVGEP